MEHIFLSLGRLNGINVPILEVFCWLSVVTFCLTTTMNPARFHIMWPFSCRHIWNFVGVILLRTSSMERSIQRKFKLIHSSANASITRCEILVEKVLCCKRTNGWLCLASSELSHSADESCCSKVSFHQVNFKVSRWLFSFICRNVLSHAVLMPQTRLTQFSTWMYLNVVFNGINVKIGKWKVEQMRSKR